MFSAILRSYCLKNELNLGRKMYNGEEVEPPPPIVAGIIERRPPEEHGNLPTVYEQYAYMRRPQQQDSALTGLLLLSLGVLLLAVCIAFLSGSPDLVQQLFSGSHKRVNSAQANGRRTRDTEAELHVSLEDLYRQARLNVSIGHRTRLCAACGGAGGANAHACHACGGAGVRTEIRRVMGFFGLQQQVW